MKNVFSNGKTEMYGFGIILLDLLIEDGIIRFLELNLNLEE
jgi:hypothetical protein